MIGSRASAAVSDDVGYVRKAYRLVFNFPREWLVAGWVLIEVAALPPQLPSSIEWNLLSRGCHLAATAEFGWRGLTLALSHRRRRLDGATSYTVSP
jgi:hypothetical protein